MGRGDLLEFYPVDRAIFTGTHISGVAYVDKGSDSVSEVDEDKDADFFSVYLRRSDGTMQCVADFYSREVGESFKSLLDMMIENGKD